LTFILKLKMKSLFAYILFFVIGLLVGVILLQKIKNDYSSEQVEIIQNGIKNVSKLVVAEESFTQFYQYTDSNKYLFETLNFDKKLILIVSAKVLVSYDLQKMETEIDTLKKKIIIKKLPHEELIIVPSFSYYDFQQSIFNSFTKDELNAVQKSSIEKLKKTLQVSKSKAIAKERLLEELRQLWSVAEILGWTIEDKTDNQILAPVFKPTHKDTELQLK